MCEQTASPHDDEDHVFDIRFNDVYPASNAQGLRETSGVTQTTESSNNFDDPIEQSQKVGVLYPCLRPLLPSLQGLMDHANAGELLLFYFRQPNTYLFTSASPYVLAPVLRPQCLLAHTKPRKTSDTLLLAILWVGAQTAQLPFLLVPRCRQDICNGLRTILFQALDSCPKPSVDTLLSLVLVAIVSTGGNRKDQSMMWWYRAIDMCERMKLSRSDDDEKTSVSHEEHIQNLCDHSGATEEAREEGRRLYWLLFALDRHWAISFNRMPLMLEADCQVFVPCSEEIWTSGRRSFSASVAHRSFGPLVEVSGAGFFQSFLPLMAVLGDIIWIHHIFSSGRMGCFLDLNCVSRSEELLHKCMIALDCLLDSNLHTSAEDRASSPVLPQRQGAQHDLPLEGSTTRCALGSMTLVAILYAKFITHVLYVLLHGRWDALDLLSSGSDSGTNDSTVVNPVMSSLSDWITSDHFQTCCSHAIAASEIISEILQHDPELAFMPYLLGIYLLHSSFILLFFAHRMSQVGGVPNESVENACERTIRAHEVCVATLDVDFQKDFRKVLRQTLYNVQRQRSLSSQITGVDADGCSEGSLPKADSGVAMINHVLSLYRWTKGHRGLAV
ncbi:hypothetical protein FANTH_1719 [Fusarium anthophilum]|uniref:Xylanolytic transcriptional activator regulatory domain-containing protein n=1 Tax=Fusarium anthophilum TaxID=48485 RepID=A0A8H5EB15_9HYPO|nr:hypothetical protein FANTH_1719 [Fusarium anthophilum]